MPCSLAEPPSLISLPLTPPLSPKRPAFLSRDLPEEEPPPPLMHTLHQEQSSVLSLAADEKHIFSGSQGYDIYVWDRRTFTLQTTLRGHTGSVLALEVAQSKNWLFSASGDSTVRVWCTNKLTPIYIINPYLDTDAGDLYCISYSASLQTVYFGCQNTSLQWFDFSTLQSRRDRSGRISSPEPLDLREADIARKTRSTKRDKFFRDGPNSGSATPTRLNTADLPKPLSVLRVQGSNVIDSAHYGYIYSMALLPCPSERQSALDSDEEGSVDSDHLLVTGSGDETVRIWQCTSSGPALFHTFDAGAGAVLSLVVRNDTIYAGCQDGQVKVFDLDTRTIIRTIIAQEGVDILSLSIIDTDLYTCSANGRVQRWSSSFDCTANWTAHNGIILSSIITRCVEGVAWRLVTGANDNCIKLWQIDKPGQRSLCQNQTVQESAVDVQYDPSEGNAAAYDTMLFALTKFVSIPSVSNSATHREDCRQAAIWLKKCMVQLGAESNLLPTGEGTNPLVLSVFHGSQSRQNRPRILFYGHYDVIAAPSDGWESDPFSLTGRNGYYYGRGATDNKGPILAAVCAVSSLLGERALGCDVVFLIEGEEEAGSAGFSDAVRRHKDLIGRIDSILVSNSTWLTEDHPCITYGLRGVVHCSIEISSGRPDLHSGIDGGAVEEPMVDMVKLLAKLSEGNTILIPGFYNAVRPLTEEEKKLYDLLSSVTGQPASALSSRWREPSLSIHNLEVSGPGNATVIPSTVKAKVSIRIVPDQKLEEVVSSLKDHVEQSFEELESPNAMRISIDNATDWWLGDIQGPWFQALESAIREEWHLEPLRIREGGSIPSVPFLEKEFGCRALHLPLGQSSDRAHLPNERISLENLRRGKGVMERFIRTISSHSF